MLAVYHFLSGLEKNAKAEDTRTMQLLSSELWADLNLVVLVVPTWQECPDAPSWPNVQRIVQFARWYSVKVVFMRQLWVQWLGRAIMNGNLAGSAYDHLHPEWYAQGISRVKAEADMLGCLSGGYWEPHSEAHVKYIKNTDRELDELFSMRDAVNKAVRETGPLDALYPCYGKRVGRYVNAFPPAGIMQMSSVLTFKSTTWEDLKYKPHPAFGEEYEINMWGLWPQPEVGLLPQDVIGASWEALREFVPTLAGFILYIKEIDWAWFMREYQPATLGDA